MTRHRDLLRQRNRISGRSRSMVAETHVHVGHILGEASEELEHLVRSLVGFDHGSVGVDDSTELGKTDGESLVL